MGKYFDFAVRFDEKTEAPEKLTERIIYSLIVRRTKGHKPTVMFVSGDSGEGKSLSALTLQLMLLKFEGLDLKDYLHDVNVFTPIEYAKKIDAMLHDARLKKVNILCLHEARNIVKAKKWHSFLNEAVADVNAMSRSIKRICFMVLSQFIRDISTDIRYTINYYVTVYRPIGKKARLKIHILWKDDRDLEKPRLRKRKIKGYIIDSKGRWKTYAPDYLEISLPPKELIDIFNKADKESKAVIIRNKLEKLVESMKSDLDMDKQKVEQMVTWYLDNTESLNKIGKKYRGKWKLKKEVKTMHDLTDIETKQFEEKLNEKLKEMGMV